MTSSLLPRRSSIPVGVGGVDEMSSSGLAGAISELLAGEAFEPQRQVLEISGRCAHCREQAHAA